MKGAMNFDKLCHQCFDGKNDGTNYLAWETDICCGRCGHKLRAYYCEERLYLIECAVCGTKALTKAGNVVFAAYKTLAHKPQRAEVALKAKPKPVTRPPQSWRYVEDKT